MIVSKEEMWAMFLKGMKDNYGVVWAKHRGWTLHQQGTALPEGCFDPWTATWPACAWPDVVRAIELFEAN